MTPRDYTKTLTDRKTLTTVMSALSLIEFHAKQGIPEDAFVQATSNVKKHVAMLDGLALLLIFKEKSECAATALVQKSGPKPEDSFIKILWAKNDSAPVTVTQQNYLNNLIASFKRLDTPDQTLRLVIDACRPKIAQRCKKIVKEFEKQADEIPAQRLQYPTDLRDIPTITRKATSTKDNKTRPNTPTGSQPLHEISKGHRCKQGKAGQGALGLGICLPDHGRDTINYQGDHPVSTPQNPQTSRLSSNLLHDA